MCSISIPASVYYYFLLPTYLPKGSPALAWDQFLSIWLILNFIHTARISHEPQTQTSAYLTFLTSYFTLTRKKILIIYQGINTRYLRTILSQIEFSKTKAQSMWRRQSRERRQEPDCEGPCMPSRKCSSLFWRQWRVLQWKASQQVFNTVRFKFGYNFSKNRIGDGLKSTLLNSGKAERKLLQ